MMYMNILGQLATGIMSKIGLHATDSNAGYKSPAAM